MKSADISVSLSCIVRRSCYSLIAVALLSSMLPFLAMDAKAQSFGSRTATVAVAEATENTLSIFSDIQGRVAAGQVIAITASANAVTTLELLRIGDMVKAGQLVATQDDADFRDRLDLLTAQRTEAALRLTEIEKTIEADRRVLEFGIR